MSKLLRAAAFLPLLLDLPARAAEVCDLVLDGCPSRHAGTVVDVPSQAVAVSPRIPLCGGALVRDGGTVPRKISLLFVIDESHSMQTADSTGARYTVPSAFLDEIAAIAPNAEVGIIPFTDKLMFDVRDNPFFFRPFPGQDYPYEFESIVPLTSLDRVFPDGKTGLDTLKDLLKVEVTHWPVSQWTPVAYDEEVLLYRTKRDETMGGTDITKAFNAAKAAMQASTALPEDRYIIFLSDGLPDAGPDADDFLQGKDVPTTFTIFFTGSPWAVDVPQKIAQMTENIRKNGYSSGNGRSASWGINQPATQLRNVLQSQVLGKISILPAMGKGAVAEVGGTRHATTRYDSSLFHFSGRMPLSAGETRLSLSFNLAYNDTTKAPPVVVETTTAVGFTVRRRDGAPLPPGFSLACREQPQLALYHGGLPVSAVYPEQATLQVRLSPPPGAAPCTGCRVEVGPHTGVDRESVSLLPAAGHSTGDFVRALAGPNPGDGIVQHTASDSLVLVYQDPLVPLDRVRKAYPFRLVQVPDPVDPTLDLYHAGVRLDSVRWDQVDLEIRMVFDTADRCEPCKVEARLSSGSDREDPLLGPGPGASLRTAHLRRELDVMARPGDGRLQHGADDSLILVFRHPERPGVALRRSYPFIPAPVVHGFRVTVENPVARKQGADPGRGAPFLLDHPIGALRIEGDPGCCRFQPGPVPPEDSLGRVGLRIESSRGFRADLRIFSNLGAFVAGLTLTVTPDQLAGLPPGSPEGTRRLRILWDGRAAGGAPAGNGAYVLRAKVSAPASGAQPAESWEDSRVIGFLR